MKDQRQRLERIAYLVVIGLLALLFVVVSYFLSDNLENFWLSLLINLSTEFIGAIVIFFVIRVLFQLEEQRPVKEKLYEKIEYLVKNRKLDENDVLLFQEILDDPLLIRELQVKAYELKPKSN